MTDRGYTIIELDINESIAKLNGLGYRVVKLSPVDESDSPDCYRIESELVPRQAA